VVGEAICQDSTVKQANAATLRWSMDSLSTITLNQHLLADDISQCLLRELEELKSLRLFPANADVQA
jgi:hypothetical protein